ncbi:MAG: glycosyltransferase family 4 protein [Terriglobales bacterium]
MTTPIRLAIMISHPIQHFAPWHAEAAKLPTLDLKVFFYSDWGLTGLDDPGFGTSLKWDIPLLEGYDHEFVPMERKLAVINDPDLDNPTVGESLDRFSPDVVQIFGYSHKTTKRVAQWTTAKGKPLLLYSDSSLKAQPLWKAVLKRATVGSFYSKVDAALYVGDNNRNYHRFFGMPEDRLFAGCLPVDRNRWIAAVPDVAATKKQIREQYGIPQDAFVLMFCGKFVAGKRPLDVLQAVAQLPEKKLWAFMVGEGELRGKMESYLHHNGMKNATITGFVNQTAIPAHYAASDVVVVSSALDAHPLVVTEGAIFGLPAIVSDAIGCIGEHDTARPGFNALVYPCGDVEALAKAMHTLRSDSGVYQSFSRGSLEIAGGQDTAAAAAHLEHAVLSLNQMGKR